MADVHNRLSPIEVVLIAAHAADRIVGRKDTESRGAFLTAPTRYLSNIQPALTHVNAAPVTDRHPMDGHIAGGSSNLRSAA